MSLESLNLLELTELKNGAKGLAKAVGEDIWQKKKIIMIRRASKS